MKIKEFFKKRKGSLKQLGGSLALLLISASIGIFIGLKETNGMGKYIDKTYEYFKENNWIALYKYMEVKDTDFINGVLFQKMAEKLYGELNGENLTLGNVKETDGKADVELNYKNSEGQNVIIDVQLVEKAEKNYLFFNQWKVNIDYFATNNCGVTVPKSFKVYIDGVELTEENTVKTLNEEEGTETYVVPRLFKGKHVLYISHDLIEVLELDVAFNEDGATYVLEDEQIRLAENESNNVKVNVEQVIQLMYKGVFEGAGIEELKPYIVQNDDTTANVQGVYDGILAAIKPADGSTLTSLKFVEFKDYEVKYLYPDKAEVSIAFNCTFKARGPRKSSGGIREKYEGSTSSTVKLSLSRSEGNWFINALDMQCIDYSKKEIAE